MSAGERGVFEREPGSDVWYARWTDAEGKKRRVRCSSKATAKKRLIREKAKVFEQRDSPEPKKAKPVLFRELCADALKHSGLHDSEKVTHDFDIKLKKLLPVFGERDATSITRQEIRQWLATESQRLNWKASTANRWQAAFSLVFRVAVDHDPPKLDRNPAAGIKRRRERNTRVRYLMPGEYVRLIDEVRKVGEKFVASVDLARNTGMRAGEQYGLRWNQVDILNRDTFLDRTKNGDSRHVPLNDAAIAALKVLAPKPGKARGSEFVFPSGSRGPKIRLRSQGLVRAGSESVRDRSFRSIYMALPTS